MNFLFFNQCFLILFLIKKIYLNQSFFNFNQSLILDSLSYCSNQWKIISINLFFNFNQSIFQIVYFIVPTNEKLFQSSFFFQSTILIFKDEEESHHVRWSGLENRKMHWWKWVSPDKTQVDNFISCHEKESFWFLQLESEYTYTLS